MSLSVLGCADASLRDRRVCDRRLRPEPPVTRMVLSAFECLNVFECLWPVAMAGAACHTVSVGFVMSPGTRTLRDTQTIKDSQTLRHSKVECLSV